MTWRTSYKKFGILKPFHKSRRSKRSSIKWSQAIKGWQPFTSFSVGNSTPQSQHLCTDHHRLEGSWPLRTTANSKWLLSIFLPKSCCIVCTFNNFSANRGCLTFGKQVKEIISTIMSTSYIISHYIIQLCNSHYFNIYNNDFVCN